VATSFCITVGTGSPPFPARKDFQPVSVNPSVKAVIPHAFALLCLVFIILLNLEKLPKQPEAFKILP
jgi:hypothetical protein